MFINKNVSVNHAYMEIALVFRTCSAAQQMSKETALKLKEAIEKYFKFSKASEYKNTLYEALLSCGQIPLNPLTNEPYTSRDTQNLPADKHNPDVEYVRSIGKFYVQLHRIIDGYEEPPERPTLSTLVSLRDVAPQDPQWVQKVCELEVYARENNVFAKCQKSDRSNPNKGTLKVTITGTVPDQRVVTFIDYLTKKYPMGSEVEFCFKDVEFLRSGGANCNGLADLHLNRARIASRLSERRSLRELIYVTAHEYKHLLQYAHKDKAAYKKLKVREREDDAANFGFREVKAALTEGVIEL